MNMADFGSPPHTWGKFRHVYNAIKEKRFTPTYVGKIPKKPKTSSGITVHPHIRGENL